MRILYLPGNTANHKEWIDRLAQDTNTALEKDILHYSHWDTGEQVINFETELDRLEKLIKDDEYIVVGKSAGSTPAHCKYAKIFQWIAEKNKKTIDNPDKKILHTLLKR